MNVKNFFTMFLSILGVAIPLSTYAQQINKIQENAPVVLKHNQDFQYEKMISIYSYKNKDISLYGHYSHYSHRSHYSHSSHSSHSSHYSSRY